MLGFKPDQHMASDPSGARLMRQTWHQLLFMHWRIDESHLRALLPDELEIDLYEGAAWLGIIPFSVSGIQPSIPGLSDYNQVSIRTCVTHHGDPGVWYLSLDASNPIAVWLARSLGHLPYHRASIDTSHENTRFSFVSRRLGRHGRGARLQVDWRTGPPLERIKPDSLAWFLTERYRLFTSTGGKIRTGEIRHAPWRLRTVHLNTFESSLLSTVGLPEPVGSPVLYHSDELAINFWPIRNTERTVRNATLLDPEGAVKPV